MGILDGLSSTVGNLLTTFGQQVTLRTYTEVFDPVAGTNTLTASDAAVRALVEDYPASDTKGGEVSGDGIVRGDKKVTIAASAVSTAPDTETDVVIGGTVFSLLKVDTQHGTDDALMYVCQARR